MQIIADTKTLMYVKMVPIQIVLASPLNTKFTYASSVEQFGDVSQRFLLPPTVFKEPWKSYTLKAVIVVCLFIFPMNGDIKLESVSLQKFHYRFRLQAVLPIRPVKPILPCSPLPRLSRTCWTRWHSPRRPASRLPRSFLQTVPELFYSAQELKLKIRLKINILEC